MVIEVCTRKKNDEKFGFYPYILILSAFFLLLCVVVYAVFPKVLFNNTQRLRLHFAANMFFAFVILSTNQLTFIGNWDMVACSAFGTDMEAYAGHSRGDETIQILSFSISAAILLPGCVHLHDFDLCRRRYLHVDVSDRDR